MKKGLLFFAISAFLTAFSLPLMAQTDDDNYAIVFEDDFNQPDGSQPDAEKWVRSKRQSSTWNRWISDSEEVVYIEDGCLVLRAIPNEDKTSDSAEMLTGAVETQGKFSFQYGKVEIRMKIEPYKGSFPAAWMMPQPPAEKWPAGGEIDIFESIDAANTAYHTIHTHWTYDLGYRNNPQSSFSEYVNISQWHVYGLEWTADQLTWTVDDKVVGRYKKSTSSANLEQGQWPFDHEFYLILNQSVGNGSWAAAAVTDHTYTSRVDYVKIYQPTALKIENIENKNLNNHTIYDLQGRRIGDINDGKTPQKGLYIIGGKKRIIK